MRLLPVRDPFSPNGDAGSCTQCPENPPQVTVSGSKCRKRGWESESSAYRDEDDRRNWTKPSIANDAKRSVGKGCCSIDSPNLPGRDTRRSISDMPFNRSCDRSIFSCRSYPPNKEWRRSMVKTIRDQRCDRPEMPRYSCGYERSPRANDKGCQEPHPEDCSNRVIRTLERDPYLPRIHEDSRGSIVSMISKPYCASVAINKSRVRVSSRGVGFTEKQSCPKIALGSKARWEKQVKSTSERNEMDSPQAHESMETSVEKPIPERCKDASKVSSASNGKLVEKLSEQNHEDACYVASQEAGDMLASLDLGDISHLEEDFKVLITDQSHNEYCGSIFDEDLDLRFNTVKAGMIDTISAITKPSGESPKEVATPGPATKGASAPEWNGSISGVKYSNSGTAATISQQAQRFREDRSHSSPDYDVTSGCSAKKSLVRARAPEAPERSGKCHRPVVIDFSDKFKLHAPPALKEIEQEIDPHRLSQRQRQIQFGKNTLGYERYIELVPRCKRKKVNPCTPDFKQTCSKRSWDGQIKKWRRLLHFYDPPMEEGEEMPVDLSKNGLNEDDNGKKGSESSPTTPLQPKMESSIYGEWEEL